MLMTAITNVFRATAATALAVGGLTAAAVSPAAAAPAEPLAAAPCVQKIAVVNNGGFTLNFQITTRTGELSAPTDTYPINQYRVVDLTSTTLTAGDDVRPLVHATAGNDATGNVYVSYCDNGQTATYTASGTTLDYQVTLLT
jgi:hypothetical protein